jgi:hypothetical protein
VPCSCPESHCVCELDLVFCDCSANWPIEYVGQIADLLADLDPESYAEPPLATRRILAVSHETRLAMYESRRESGRAIFHPGDMRPDCLKNGERIEVGRNGSVAYTGSGTAPETKYRSRWRGRNERAGSEDAEMTLAEL